MPTLNLSAWELDLLYDMLPEDPELDRNPETLAKYYLMRAKIELCRIQYHARRNIRAESKKKRKKVIRAKEHLDKCTEKCDYNPSGICAYGYRNRAGCYLDNQEKHEDLMRSQSFLTMQREKIKYLEREDDSLALEELDRIINKSFRFVFKGHEYTLRDSARVQSQCPHCGHNSAGGRCWSEDDEGYIGTYKTGKEKMLCFECPECFEKFFYHGVV